MSAVLERRSVKLNKEVISASDRLLKAVKDKMLRKSGKIDYAQLRKQGYSEATIARLKEI
jgi:hypothetical protein